MLEEDKSRITPLGLLVLLMILGGIGWILWQANRQIGGQESTLARIQREGTVRIGFANEDPYGYFDTSTGNITGEAPEIAKRIFQKMGIENVEAVVADFGSLIPGLKAKRFDVIAAGMYITPERAEEVAFSNPTYGIGEAFIVLAGNPLGLHSYEDLRDNPNAKLGVMGGSVEQGYAREIGIPNSRVLKFADYTSAITGLRGRQIDAIAATDLTVNELLRKQNSDSIEKAADFQDPVIDGKTIRGYGAFGFRQEDKDLRREFNDHLMKFIGTDEHLELVKPFGFDESTLPGDVTVLDLTQTP